MNVMTPQQSMIRILLTVLLIAAPLSAHSYERGALAPKDPPLMPTVIVYSGNNDATEPSPVTPTSTPESSAAAPTNAPTPNSAESLSPTALSAPNTVATPPKTVTITPVAPATTIVPTVANPKHATSSTLHHIMQFILLIALLGGTGALIWWLRKPYTPPHVRRKADNERDLSIDLDLDD